ncbi:leucine-rich repeat domain-containing protein [Leptothoe kymatousa TAU-MAC 1615]|uniref:non-specific serine/threonine protein kinase n=1 Tax=Leptothoe kymatousa TAU-MAC 1615 TaxID=2364775 RepID=A0ABS5Y339_9CYAN|nr:leucine-rich repeat domain-containing protein [Leptothoe kymatousa TAU-MAC 1615]
MTTDELLALIDQAEKEGWTELDLAGQGLSELPEEIGKLTQLERLILGKGKKDKDGDQQWGHTLINGKLQWGPLTIGNNLSDLPDCLANLTHLRYLNLSGNSFEEIPGWIAKLSRLETLIAFANQINEISEHIAQLTSLQQLYLSSNQISEIPDSLTGLGSLQQLYLISNQISEIPDSLTGLGSLQQLYLSSNQISEIPDSLAGLGSLQQLYLSSNQISEIPDSLAGLGSLQQLYLSSNQISEIPDSLAGLGSLQQLYLISNQISEIPDSLAGLGLLQQLDLRFNQISEIPDSLAGLGSLQQLYLSSNQISQIPESLENLIKLKTLDVRNNPLPISPEILGSKQKSGSVSGIFNYCRQLRSGDVRPLNEAKLILVGQGSVGKTSLISRLIKDSFNPNEEQTDGLNVSNWQINVNTKDVRLNVWDFGGQEIYHATHQFFLTKRSLYLLVCNCRTSEDENRLDYWLKLIKSFGDDAPVIIVGNKRDEQPLDINRKALRDKYPNIKFIIETSCSDGTGIDELNQAILKEVGQLKEVYDLLPLSWFEVKEKLENLDKDFIKYSKYESICGQQGIEEEKDQTQLINLLHNLGLVLNYSDHPLLKHTNVLNPDWVTTGIYTLLSDDDLKTESKGQLTLADLTRILPPNRYPEQRHTYLIELMKEFQLCFQLPECSPERYLIPGILPKEEPEDTDLEGDTLEFQYHYTVLPDSVISRFIVLMHDKIHEQTYWRSGVMLAYTEGDEVYNIARIKADSADNKIFIAISGNQSTRRLFLGLIRDVFKKIHANFAKPTEWVPVPEHPEHPPLDYQELLGLEDMGEQNVVIGKLKLKLNLRQLLDGYESATSRQQLWQAHKDTDHSDSLYTDDSDIDDEFQIDIFSIK